MYLEPFLPRKLWLKLCMGTENKIISESYFLSTIIKCNVELFICKLVITYHYGKKKNG